jgi:flagellar basal-body rod protein FlgG
MRALDIAATGMQAQQTNIEVISHNLANQTTTGFKKFRAEFQDLLYDNLRRVGSNSAQSGTIVPTGVQVGLGVRTAATYRNHIQGSIKITDNPLDVAIQGKGFYQIEMPDGTIGYTRAGTFQLSRDGEIVTVDGYRVLPGITVPQDAESISINKDGEVQVTIPGQTDPQLIGRFELANFINPNGLEAVGDNLYFQTPASGDPIVGNAGQDNFGTIMQGFLENSNVDPVTEISTLITAQRAYEMNAKIITAADEMMKSLNQAA